MAKRKCDRLKPKTDIEQIRLLQEQTRDALLRLEYSGNIGFSGLLDIGASVKRLEVKASLSDKELLDLSSVLGVASNAKDYGEKSMKDVEDINKAINISDTKADNQLANDNSNNQLSNANSYDSLSTYFNMLIPLNDIRDEIRRCILAEGEIADDASRALKEIRQKKKAANERLRQELSKLLSNDEFKDKLQENLITTRGGRYCIPVKQEYASFVKGMVHDRSKSSSTVFIEPLSVVNLNNEISELESDELVEIEAILENLSLLAAAAIEDIKFDIETLVELDFIFARAKYARSIKASQPIFNTDGIIDIRAGRHPLLDKNKVVPIDLKLGEGYNLLIVTGPNTGGKTVSLKTLGLFTLMGQAGLHIPALDGSRLSVYEDVFADIGDEQSIEQNLSTFSSHMSNIVYIVNHCTPDCLCLFDELGGGTDPVEGAALAVSILNHLKSMGATCMATTHYSELKTYAISTDGVENASCEFDVETLSPTYKLLIGIPGKSNAFAISQKLGLPEYIITGAKDVISDTSIHMEDILAEIDKNRRETEEALAAAEAAKKEAEQLRKRAEDRDKQLAEKKSEILDKARAEAKELIDEAKETADKTIRDYNKWRNSPGSKSLAEMEEKRSSLRDKSKKLSAVEENKPKQTSNHLAKDFMLGQSVQVISLNTGGSIVGLPDAKGFATVQMGIMKSKLHISDLLIKQDAEDIRSKKPKMAGSGNRFNKAMTFSPEINVLGMTVDEAVMAVDKFIDDAFLAHAGKVTIIHGKGTGALRKGIQNHLKTLKHVKSFRQGEFGEGDYGVTVVEL